MFPRILTTLTAAARSAWSSPSFDVVIATVATLLFLRGAPQDRPPSGWRGCRLHLLRGLRLRLRGAVQRAGAFTFGSVTDLGWIIGYALIALATRSPGSEASPARRVSGRAVAGGRHGR